MPHARARAGALATRSCETGRHGTLRGNIPQFRFAFEPRVINQSRRRGRHTCPERVDLLLQMVPEYQQLPQQEAMVLEQLDAIPGVNRRTIEKVVAEIHSDISVLPGARHLVSTAAI